jgi:hypothetical protein
MDASFVALIVILAIFVPLLAAGVYWYCKVSRVEW